MLHYVATVAFTIIVLVRMRFSRPDRLNEIPTVGSSSWLGSWWAALMYMTNALDVIQEGYEKHKTAPFKIAEIHRWTVILSNGTHVEEVASAPDDVLSITEATNDRFCVEHTFGPEIHNNPDHARVIHSVLTRHISAMYPELRDELVAAFDDALHLRGNEWKSMTAFRTMEKIVCRTSNRLLVGLPLCRNPEWIDLIIKNTFGIIKAAVIVWLFPDSLKAIAARFLTNVYRTNRRARELLRHTFEERCQQIDEYRLAEWADKPNDFVSRLMDEEAGPTISLESVTAHVLAVNFAATQTLSVSLTHALFYLAAHPQYIHPLREEVERIVEQEGWTKVAVDKMRKVDSFLKECQRLEGVDGVSLVRKAVKDYTFSDGTFVPKGTTMIAAARPIHLDETIYNNARAFEPFRFLCSDEEPGKGSKDHFVSTAKEYLVFGHGRRACPGRFFAANVLKSLLAHMVMTYDIRLEGKKQPKTIFFGPGLIPDPTAKVMFRRKVES